MAIIATAINSAALAEPQKPDFRPRYHFTAETGYINDPNGLFFLNRTCHLYYQSGPITAKRWGHATSRDLIRRTQHDDAIIPVGGLPAFSGCAVVDRVYTSGLATMTFAVVPDATDHGEVTLRSRLTRY